MKRAGEPASLTMDFPSGYLFEEGDVCESPTGRRYLIVGARRVEGRQPGRWKLDALVMAESDDLPEGSQVHPFVWHSRSRAA